MKIKENGTSGKLQTAENTRRPGYLFILSAPSGAGKTTLRRALLNRVSDLLYSVSYTTREPREGEQNGDDYFLLPGMNLKQVLPRVIGLNGLRCTVIFTAPRQRS